VGVVSQGLSKIFRAAICRAHRAVVFAIAQLSCYKWCYLTVIISLVLMVTLVCLITRYVHYGSGPKRFPIQDVLQCALEFAEHGPVTSQQPTDVPPTDTITAAGENMASATAESTTCLGSNCTQAAGIMDVDMESPHSLSRYP